jgi:MFS family permease
MTEKVPFSRHFWIMSAGSLLFFCSFNLPVPEFNAHLEQLGRPDLKGLVIPLFSLMALISRPFSGVLTDTIGRKPVMLLGALACLVCSMLYPWAGIVSAFLMLRLFHGLSTGFTPTGCTAFIADTVHPSRRGEAMGLSGLMSNVGTALGFSIGPLLAAHFSRDWTYGLAACMALAALLIFYSLPETRWRRQRFAWNMLKVHPRDMLDRHVWEPATVMCLVCINLGAILTVIPDHTALMGFSNKGVFMTVYIVSSLLVRMLSGKLSDRYGRALSVILGTSCLTMSMLILMLFSHPISLFPAAILFGFGQGFNAPALFAWTTDLSKAENKGKSFATLFIALELGITIGGLAAGFIYNNKPVNLTWVFALCAVSAFAALLFVISRARLRKKIAINRNYNS